MVKSFLLAYRSGGYWKGALPVFFTATLAALGTLWLLTELLMFIEIAPKVVAWLKSSWWVFAVGGVAYGAWDARPKLSVMCSLKNRDVRIEVRVGDLFAGTSGLVIGCNTSFDTDLQTGLISPRSVQGQFTKKYYSDTAHLDTDLAQALAHPLVAQPNQDPTKRGKPAVYPIGTTVTLRPRGRTTYLCAIAHMNAHGNASATFDDLKNALPALWDHVTSNGDAGDIVLPVLGSGFGRVAESRETLIREILSSFIAACAAQRPCSSLAVVIHPSDYYNNSIDLHELGLFLTHLCKYTVFTAPGAHGAGRPMPARGAPIAPAGGVAMGPATPIGSAAAPP